MKPSLKWSMLVLGLCACAHAEVDPVPTPSTFSLGEMSLDERTRAAETGDLLQINYLVSYYQLEKNDDSQVFRWMLEGADRGSIEYRRDVIEWLHRRHDAVSNGTARFLCHKWTDSAAHLPLCITIASPPGE